MANYMNGSCLHVYNEALTFEMLQIMHEAHQQMIDDVQAKAKERVQKLH